jgi:glutaredoxin 3
VGPVTVYTTAGCRHCTQAKALLDRAGIPYLEIRVPADDGAIEEVAAKTGMLTFPQILIGDEPIGGFKELVDWYESGRLAALSG